MNADDSGEAAEGREAAGLAHVAALAFVGARTIPGFGFPVSLMGGTAIARSTHRHGGRRGLSGGIAAAIESIAILGPARMSGPIGQLVTAPMIGVMTRRGRSRTAQIAACALTRGAFNAIGTLFAIYIVAGGLGTFTSAFDATFGKLPLVPEGTAAALAASGLWLVIWAIGASWFQVFTIHRAFARWPAHARAEMTAPAGATGIPDTAADEGGHRLDPRAVTAAAAIAFTLLLITTDPVLLAAVTSWLIAAWALSPAPRSVLKPGAVLAATLAVGAISANLIGGEGIATASERAARAALLVAVATWMRGAAGPDGFREVVRRLLARLRRFDFPGRIRRSLRELEGDRRMGPALTALGSDLRASGETLTENLDTILDWIAAEAERFEPSPAKAAPRLAYRPLDGVLLVAAGLPALALAGG